MRVSLAGTLQPSLRLASGAAPPQRRRISVPPACRRREVRVLLATVPAPWSCCAVRNKIGGAGFARPSHWIGHLPPSSASGRRRRCSCRCRDEPEPGLDEALPLNTVRRSSYLYFLLPQSRRVTHSAFSSCSLAPSRPQHVGVFVGRTAMSVPTCACSGPAHKQQGSDAGEGAKAEMLTGARREVPSRHCSGPPSQRSGQAASRRCLRSTARAGRTAGGTLQRCQATAVDAQPCAGDEGCVVRRQPEDVAKAIAYLASDDATFVTGAGLRVDGGRLATRSTACTVRPARAGRPTAGIGGCLLGHTRFAAGPSDGGPLQWRDETRASLLSAFSLRALATVAALLLWAGPLQAQVGALIAVRPTNTPTC